MTAFKVKEVNIGSGLPKICIPLISPDMETLTVDADVVDKVSCDLVEWRVDHMAQSDKQKKELKELTLIYQGLETIRSKTEKPIMLTMRTSDEGGMLVAGRREYYTIIRDIVENREELPDLIDIEAFDTDAEDGFDRVEFVTQLAKEAGVKVVLSNHDFDKTPPLEEIVKRICIMAELGADLPKVAYMPQSEEDVLKVIEAARITAEYTEKPFIALSMGEAGLPTRICSGSKGTAITFATAGRASAPGQVDVARMKEMLHRYYENDR